MEVNKEMLKKIRKYERQQDKEGFTKYLESLNLTAQDLFEMRAQVTNILIDKVSGATLVNIWEVIDKYYGKVKRKEDLEAVGLGDYVGGQTKKKRTAKKKVNKTKEVA